MIKSSRKETAIILAAITATVLLVILLVVFLFNATTARHRFHSVNLAEKLNAKLTESVCAAGGNDGPNNLATFPQGLRHFGGTLFDVQGMIQLGSRHLRMVHKDYPERVSGLSVSQKCRRLHLLHGAGWGAGEGKTIATLMLHYADGAETEIKIRFGEHVLGWWGRISHPDKTTDRHTTLAWSGSNPVASDRGFKLCIYKTTFENPRPSVPIESIDYVSAMGNAAPFMIALTVE